MVESTQLDDDEVDLDMVGDLDEHKPKIIISSFGFMIVLRFWCVGKIMIWLMMSFTTLKVMLLEMMMMASSR